jgi:hypothetical protein
MVRSFRGWQLPHGNLPNYWTSCHILNAPDSRLLPQQSTLAKVILARDLTCWLTNHVESTEHAHLVPPNEQAWFDDNAVLQYTNLSRVDINGIDDSLNGILLRSDVHTLFEQRRFALTPKPSFGVVDRAAEDMDRCALEGREKALGPDHPDTLTNFRNLADVLRGQGKYSAAEEMSRR